MPASKITLPDINVCVALASDRHVHHRLARDWFTAIPGAGAAFCRVTQIGFLRLLTNSRVMGEDVYDSYLGFVIYCGQFKGRHRSRTLQGLAVRQDFYREVRRLRLEESGPAADIRSGMGWPVSRQRGAETR